MPCASCGADAVGERLDFGPQPIANRFLPAGDAPEDRFPLAMGQCTACGLVQLPTPVPAAAMHPPYSWLVYNEPEPHLDDLADRLVRLDGVAPQHVCGISSVDDSLLRRLRERGVARTWRLDPEREFGASVVPPGVATIQSRLDAGAATRIAEREGPADLVVGRYVVEHAHDLCGFLRALRRLVRPDGYVAVEVPDCAAAFEFGDFSAVWEEHTLYFTAATLRRTFERAGYEVVILQSYEYRMQNALVVIARAPERLWAGAVASNELVGERARWQTWRTSWSVRRDAVRTSIEPYRRRGAVAIFGAAQRACSFVNLLGLGQHIDFAVDDDPHKQGLFMPGSRLPILPSSTLLDRGVTLCLVAAAPERQGPLVQKHAAFIASGGTFVSIYPQAQAALHN